VTSEDSLFQQAPTWSLFKSDYGRLTGYAEVGPHKGLGVGEADFGPETYLPWKMAWLMSGQNSRNTSVIPSREALSNHR
jgi:hypothetical protein